MKILNQNTPAKIKFYSGEYHYDNYCWLCFLLGGIDLVDLVNLRWDVHVKKGRLNFERFKGGTSEIIDNMIPKEAEYILKQYSDSYPYLINANGKNYENLRHNYIVRFRKYLKSIGIESYFSSKTPRYTFSSIGKELGLNRLTIMEIMGHSIGDTHAIYEGKFHNKMKDSVHRKIISSVKLKIRLP
jgi:integrase